MKVLRFLVIVLSVFIVFQSCEKDDNEQEISSYNDTESHNMGENCMTCHSSEGSGEGWFTLAGTIYDSLKISTFPNATVYLYSEPNGLGNIMGTIEVDGLGNFYTTDYIDFGNGLYTSVSGNTSTKYMSSAINTGQCNGCHGVSTNRIWTK